MSSVIFEPVARNICTILINRPAKRNALNIETIKKLRSALQKFEDDDNFCVAIIGGTGGNFCAGYDLNEIVDSRTGMPNMQNVDRMLWPLGTKLSSRKLTIAAIEGHAAGFGFELALKCHFRVADRDSRLGFLNRRFGVPILNGGTVILPKLIGLAKAMDLVATGKAQPAPEALQFGIITHISDIGCAFGRSLNLARNLSKFKQESLLHDLKQLMDQDSEKEIELLKKERANSLQFLEKCGLLEVVSKFIEGELCRHGNTDLGNLIKPMSEVTL